MGVSVKAEWLKGVRRSDSFVPAARDASEARAKDSTAQSAKHQSRPVRSRGTDAR